MLKRYTESEIASFETNLIPYIPFSKSPSVETKIQKNIAIEVYKSLQLIENQEQDIDFFVKSELQYTSIEELYSAFSGEQVDALALTIWNIKNGTAPIVGDMAGIGKGRIAAGIIRYAKINGYNPVFFTIRENLFSDIYDDLKNIGSGDLIPLIINSEPKASIQETFQKPDGETGTKIAVVKKGNLDVPLRAKSSKELEDILSSTDFKSIPEPFDFVVSTYSQVTGDYVARVKFAELKKKKPKDIAAIKPKGTQFKTEFLRNLPNKIFICDESHVAGGDSTTGLFIAEIIRSSIGGLFLSATYAKSPANMPLYSFKSVMAEANLSNEELVNGIKKGGVALQEVISSQLAQSGQMIRRERDFDGIKVIYKELTQQKEEHAQKYDAVCDIMNRIIVFQEAHVNPYIKQLDEKVKEEGGKVEERKGTDMAGVNNQPFVSRTFNLVNQLLFSLKAPSVADYAIKICQGYEMDETSPNYGKIMYPEGRKPVIAFKDTFGSFLDSLELNNGDIISNTDFSLILKRAVDNILVYTITQPNGDKEKQYIDVRDLPMEAQAEYNELVKKMQETSYGLSISPIDLLRYKIEAAGFRVGEITGRKSRIDFTDEDLNEGIVTNYSANKIKIINGFNNSTNPDTRIDVLFINSSGSTGLSVHSSSKFVDKRQRIMITTQIELDVNIEIQKRGRVNRTGQVNRPEYHNVISSIPAEKRLFMMFKSKLRSLDANTSGNQKASEKVAAMDDFLNKYGADVVLLFLIDNPEIANLLYLKKYSKESDKEKENKSKNESKKESDESQDEESDATESKLKELSQILGRVALLKTEMQEKFYKEVTEAYIKNIKMLIENNQFDLEINFLDLNAEVLNSKRVIQGSGGSSLFGSDVILETCLIDVLKFPMKKDAIDRETKNNLGEETNISFIKKLSNLADEYMTIEKSDIEVRKQTNLEKYEKNFEEIRQKLAVETDPDKIEKLKLKQKTFEDGLIKFNENIQNSERSIEAKYITIKNMLNFFKVGGLVKIPDANIQNATTYGIVTGVFIDLKRTPNPFVLSNIEIEIATQDTRRKIIYPLSSGAYYLNEIIAYSNFITESETDYVLKNWDANLVTSKRQKAYFLKGNLLLAVSKAGALGKFIKYTTIDGNVETGLLISESASDSDKFKNLQSKTLIPIKNAYQEITSFSIGVPAFAEDNILYFINRGNGVELVLPSVNSRGLRLHTDQNIIRLTNEGTMFNRMGNFYGSLTYDNLKLLLNYLSDTYKINYQSLKSPEEVQQEEMESGERFRYIKLNTTSSNKLEYTAYTRLVDVQIMDNNAVITYFKPLILPLLTKNEIYPYPTDTDSHIKQVFSKNHNLNKLSEIIFSEKDRKDKEFDLLKYLNEYYEGINLEYVFGYGFTIENVFNVLEDLLEGNKKKIQEDKKMKKDLNDLDLLIRIEQFKILLA